MDFPCDMRSLARKKELRIGLISNTNSGHNRDHLSRVNAILDRHPCVHHVPTSHGDDVRPALDELARREIDILAINGGDGTTAKVLGHVLDDAPFPRRPPVVVLPGGTANMTAGVVGGYGNLIDAVQRLCDWATGGRRACAHARHPILRVKLGDHGAVSYGMFLGAGTVIQGTEYAHRAVHPLGLRGDSSLSVIVARTIWGIVRKDPRFARPVSMGLALDDEAPLP
ncbi:MAG: acylglycerol kinase family protein, partial [Pseudomonadales bacterium]|nr:acylglycerol kinase family protein [Pseudomonadales bacterium]